MSIKKDPKTGNWYFRVDIGRDPKTGKRKQKYKGGFQTKKAAHIELTNIQNKLMKGSYFEPSIDKFSTFITRWFDGVYRNSVEVTTAESREYIVKKHLVSGFGESKISEIDSFAIDEFYENKLEEGLSPAYIRIIYSLLNQAFDKALKWKLIKHNPVLDSSPPIVKNNKKKNLWTLQETKIFIEFLTMKGIEAPYITTIFTGMRRGELLGLKWSDIDFNAGTIHVQRSLTRTQKNGIILKEVKTESSNRIIAITEFLINILKEHQNNQDIYKKKFGVHYSENDFVFCTIDGKPIEPRNLLRHYQQHIKEAKVSKITFHDLRHLHATTLMALGENPKIVADRLGHSRVQVTLDFYSHVSPDLQRKSAEKFERAYLENIQ